MTPSAGSFLDGTAEEASGGAQSAGAFLDATPSTSGPEISGGASDQFLGGPTREEMPPQEEPLPSLSSIAGNFAAAGNRAATGIIGIPGTVNNAIENALAGALGMKRAQRPPEADPLTGPGMAKLIGADKFQPRNIQERMAAKGGQFAGELPFMLLGGAGLARALPQVAGETMGPQIARTIAEGTIPKTAGELGSQVAGMTAAGAGGEALKEAAPEEWKPTAEVVGQMAGGLGQSLISEGIPAAGRSGMQAAENFFRPFTKAGQQQMAGQRILDAAKNPEAVKQALQNPPEELVPGSKPTLAEVTQDPGIIQWQDAMRSKNRGEFLQQKSQQEMARNEHIAALAPEGSDSGAVGKFFRDQLNAIDQSGESSISGATRNLQQQTEKLGGFGRQQEYGAAMRGELENAAAASKKEMGKLWDALKPYDKAVVNGSPIQQAVKGIMEGVNQQAGQSVTAAESPLYQAIGNWADHPNFGTLRDLRSEISAAQRKLRFEFGDESQPMRRVGMLKNSVDAAIENAVKGVVDHEAQALAAGQMAAEDSLMQRLASMKEDFYAARGASAATQARGGGSQSFGGYAPGRSESLSGAGRTAGQAGRGSSPLAGDQGISFDAAGQQQYAAAREATVKHKQAYRQGAVGEALAPGRGGAEFRIGDSDVATKFFNARDNSPASIKAYTEAVGGNETAVQNLKAAAMADLRTRAITPEGTINPKVFDAWVKRHDKALSAFPELRQQLGSVQKAQAALEEAGAAKQAALESFNSSRAASFLDNDPIVAVQKAFAPGASQKAFEDLVGRVKGDAAAMDGLKRAVTDYILKRVRGKVEGDTSGIDLYGHKRFRKFVDDNRPALKTVFGGQGINHLERVAADLRRYSETTKGAKLGEQSNTTQDKAAMEKYGVDRHSIMQWLKPAFEVGVGAVAGSVVDHAVTGGVAGAITSALRQAGINSVEKLELEAAFNPELGNLLLQKIPQNVSIPFQKRLAAQLMKIGVPVATSDVMNQGEPRRNIPRIEITPGKK